MPRKNGIRTQGQLNIYLSQEKRATKPYVMTTKGEYTVIPQLLLRMAYILRDHKEDALPRSHDTAALPESTWVTSQTAETKKQ